MLFYLKFNYFFCCNWSVVVSNFEVCWLSTVRSPLDQEHLFLLLLWTCCATVLLSPWFWLCLWFKGCVILILLPVLSAIYYVSMCWSNIIFLSFSFWILFTIHSLLPFSIFIPFHWILTHKCMFCAMSFGKLSLQVKHQ